MGTSVAAIIALLVGAGDDRVSTRDAFTLFENNTGWANGKIDLFTVTNVRVLIETDGWAFLLAFTAPMWTLTGCRFFLTSSRLKALTTLLFDR